MLEKQLMHDASIQNSQPTLHNILDLKAYYDYRLPSLGYMVQEAVGVNRQALKVFTKVLLIMEHHVCAGFRISQRSCGSALETLSCAWWGTSVLGSICHNILCLIFKLLEQLNHGEITLEPRTSRKHKWIAIAFVDNTDFYSNSKNCELNVAKIMVLYAKLYEAEGGKMQLDKIVFYCLIWKHENAK